ncbi:MAG: hypothetical protein A2286_14150 [Gammaproteobacteria bacterium RIFOXYA12_FULL_61_12]|nr:MAG: hypothetical protein A2514_07820 [Gammaproteobacteria bacterium RIFOXYD12_FULL_61_37]OGT89616.1 MAG: hypothetical protein A2286_14150 [Gammaproteobacteria bacterium RIFOXYA12_FULL_61_12]
MPNNRSLAAIEDSIGRPVVWLDPQSNKVRQGFVAEIDEGDLVKIRPDDRRQRAFWCVLGWKITLK